MIIKWPCGETTVVDKHSVGKLEVVDAPAWARAEHRVGCLKCRTLPESVPRIRADEAVPVEEVVVLRVIRTRAISGQGVPGDPVRLVEQYWTVEGELLWTDDRRAKEGLD